MVVSDPGTHDIRYAMQVLALNDDGKGLKDQLDMTVRAANPTQPEEPCHGAGGPVLYEGDLDGSDGQILGGRTLSTGESETLCITVELPLESGNEFQGASTVATLNFLAEAAGGR